MRYNFFIKVLSEDSGELYTPVDTIGFEGCPTPRTGSIIVPRPFDQDQQLWRILANVLARGVTGISLDIFDQLIKRKGLHITSFTIFLFWIDSKNFLPLDNDTVSYLRDLNYLKSRSINYHSYQLLLKTTAELDYVQVSKEAHYHKNYVPPESLKENGEKTSLPIPSVKSEIVNHDFKKTLKSRVGEFKIVGLKVYEATDKKWKKVLATDNLYQLSHAYDLSKRDFIAYDSAKDIRLYNFKGTSISVSAIVGRNGSGKSSLVDLIYIALNNLSMRHPDIPDEMEYVPKVYMDLHYAAEDFYTIKLRGDDLRIDRFRPVDNGYRFEEELTVAEFSLEDLFYTVSLNYAHFSLNALHIGTWINYLFHKNDAYQQPLVLNPHRNDGNIEVNEEESFASARLLSNLLFFDPDPTEAGKIALFRELTDKQRAERIELKFNKEKLNFVYVINSPTKKEPNRKIYGQWDEVTPVWVDFVRTVEKVFNIPSNPVVDDPLGATTWTDIAYKYLFRKAVTMSLKYKKYDGEYQRTKKRFKNLEIYLDRLINDNSHVAYKFKQVVNFLKYGHLREFLVGRSTSEAIQLDIQKLSLTIYETIRDHPEAGLNTMQMIPPSFFSPDIILTEDVRLSGLSSGEKQKIFAAGTIAYHLINIDSGNHDDSQIRYKFVNIIFDEIELYYHPEMQRTFIDFLLRYLSYLPLELAGINITFITHSPFILSDIPSDNIAFLGGERSAWKTFSANIHDMLADSFFLDKGVMGEYSKGTIISLTAFLTGKPAVGDFAWTRETAADTIRIIGEPIIQQQLKLLWQKKYAAVDRRTEIEELTIRLKTLIDAENSQQ